MSLRNGRGKKRLTISTPCTAAATSLTSGYRVINECLSLIFSSTPFNQPSGCYTGLGIEDLTGIAALHPDKSFVRYAGETFPFNDKVFEWVFSNAVIEHVGPAEKQLHFVAEMLRVGRRVFFTTPNKFFLFETHTNLPLVHWHDGLLDLWCARFRPRLRGNLHLLSYRQLDTLMQKTNAHYTIYRNRLLLPVGVLTPTFTVACSKIVRDWNSSGPCKVVHRCNSLTDEDSSSEEGDAFGRFSRNS